MAAGGRARLREGLPCDGYPRTVAQVAALDTELAKAGRPLDAVVSLMADVDEVVRRLLKRAEIEGRSDDNEDTIRVRLQVYAEQTAPLLDIYRQRGMLVEVDGLGPIERFPAALQGARRHRTLTPRIRPSLRAVPPSVFNPSAIPHPSR